MTRRAKPTAAELARRLHRQVVRCVRARRHPWRFGNDLVDTIAQRIVAAIDFTVESPTQVLDAWLAGTRQVWN